MPNVANGGRVPRDGGETGCDRCMEGLVFSFAHNAPGATMPGGCVPASRDASQQWSTKEDNTDVTRRCETNRSASLR